MKKLSADDQILDWLRKKGSITIEGNKEYYVIIDYSKSKFIYRFGDTVLNEDTEVKEMNEIEILEYIKGYFVRKAQVFHQKKLRNNEEVWNYIQENPNI
jgi:hypothetical protein